MNVYSPSLTKIFKGLIHWPLVGKGKVNRTVHALAEHGGDDLDKPFTTMEDPVFGVQMQDVPIPGDTRFSNSPPRTISALASSFVDLGNLQFLGVEGKTVLQVHAEVLLRDAWGEWRSRQKIPGSASFMGVSLAGVDREFSERSERVFPEDGSVGQGTVLVKNELKKRALEQRSP